MLSIGHSGSIIPSPTVAQMLSSLPVPAQWYAIKPVAYVRQTQKDKWLKPPRPKVARYRAYRDEVKLHKLQVPVCGAWVLFAVPMPKSWSQKRRRAMEGMPMESVPDKDNLLKGLYDALGIDDKVIWDDRGTRKVWSSHPGIAVAHLGVWPPLPCTNKKAPNAATFEAYQSER